MRALPTPRPGGRSLRLAIATAALLLAAAPPAFADATAFIGSTTTPENRPVRGLAIGVGLLIVGFELEFASTGDAIEDAAPALRTGMANVLLQTPIPIAGMQFYVTTGAGFYREKLGARAETHAGLNTGGGAKINLLGPIRARLDYRIFNLRGDPLHSTVHRVYAGLNLAF